MTQWENKIAVVFLGALAFAAPAGSVQGQPGTVAGTVTDAATGQPLAGAQVHIPALATGALSRPEGRFVLTDVPPGTHELEVDLIGYVPLTRTVSVAANETVILGLRLHATALPLPEIVVTGTAFEESPVTLPYAVTVSGRRTLAEQGSPQAVDFFKNLGASHGIIGERQSWYNSGQAATVPETVANVNLRGLGSSRTLVLLNGRRQVYVPARLIGGRFVDVNAFPSVALDRIEVLKEGASAIYGSDAVAGVANFMTRKDFEGFEVSGAHEYFRGSGDTNAGGIWGRPLGGRAHAVVSAEVWVRQALRSRDRDWALRPFTPGGGAWSYTGNPGAFLFPELTGSETKEEFVTALVDAQFGDGSGVFIDPNCENFGGHLENETCRFRYQPWDNLLEASRHVRAFAELNGSRDRLNYHLEALWSEATTPDWVTTPSYPPISPYNGVQVIEPGNPGRQAFCRNYAQAAGFASESGCLGNDWYFYGRLVGNSGPGRTLRRGSRTQRIAASLEREIELPGGRDANLDLAFSFSRSAGNMNLPAEYAYRKFLAFRGFGGPNCGVGVVRDPESPSGMALGALNGAVAGQGGCLYYNPFSNAHAYSRQPGARYENQANPDYVAGLENSPELIDWINAEVDLDNTANLWVADAMLKGDLVEDRVRYATGYQFRLLDVSATPNRPGDLSVNPCPVPGDTSCLEKVGPFTFTTGFYPYDDVQTVHRLFAEFPVSLGPRVNGQVAANYEFHKVASSFDPKVAVRVQLADPLVFRASVQTTFRTPSVDDVNEDGTTSLEYVTEAGIYKAVDTFGSDELEPERAFTYNAGLNLLLTRLRASLDYWRYDFENVIDVLPQSGVTRLYDMGGAARAAVREFVTCPDGQGTGTCEAAGIERIRVNLINWPGIETSGFDWHLSTRLPANAGIISLGTDGTYTRSFYVKALQLNGVEIHSAQDGVGKLNWFSPIAPPLPSWKLRVTAGYHVGGYSLVTYLNSISSYINQAFPDTKFERIDRFITWDVSLLQRMSDGIDVSLSALNLLGSDPPPVNWEQGYDGFTHNPKGRRVKMSLTYRFGDR